ncbi:hypothetical protein BACPU_11440 [Bacillus pumilus]|nr:hypothetical protein BACPU_11440 [Bacillus pumilus]
MMDDYEFLHNIFNSFISDKPIPQEVYHYTDIQAFKEILKNELFWISHINFLNDMTEIKYTLGLSREIMISFCQEKELSESETESIMRNYDMLITLFFEQEKKDCYSLSFSTNPDSNLLWSNYSKDDGYCIKFDLNKLIDSFKESGFNVMFSQVNYDISQQKVLLEKVLIGIFNTIRTISNKRVDLKGFLDESSAENKEDASTADLEDVLTEESSKILNDASAADLEDVLKKTALMISEKVSAASSDEIYKKLSGKTYSTILYGGLNLINYISIFFKDECFSQEEEFRIAIFNIETYKCRISNGTFIPYIESKFDKKAVSGVSIGPKNNMDINLEGLRKFLKLVDIDISPDEIKKSRIPYRF